MDSGQPKCATQAAISMSCYISTALSTQRQHTGYPFVRIMSTFIIAVLFDSILLNICTSHSNVFGTVICDSHHQSTTSDCPMQNATAHLIFYRLNTDWCLTAVLFCYQKLSSQGQGLDLHEASSRPSRVNKLGALCQNQGFGF